jgi:hypothetical protein
VDAAKDVLLGDASSVADLARNQVGRRRQAV